MTTHCPNCDEPSASIICQACGHVVKPYAQPLPTIAPLTSLITADELKRRVGERDKPLVSDCCGADFYYLVGTPFCNLCHSECKQVAPKPKENEFMFHNLKFQGQVEPKIATEIRDTAIKSAQHFKEAMKEEPTPTTPTPRTDRVYRESSSDQIADDLLKLSQQFEKDLIAMTEVTENLINGVRKTCSSHHQEKCKAMYAGKCNCGYEAYNIAVSRFTTLKQQEKKGQR